MTRIGCILMCFCSIAATGCQSLQTAERKAAFSVGATELKLQSINADWKAETGVLTAAGVQTQFDKRDYLGYVASQSELLCGKFLSGLVVSANGTNSGLDMMTTVFSALGTAFTPLSTVHAMTAGASITSGWKSAIDTDVYSKMGVQNIVQAIQATYYKDMGAYIQQLEVAKSDELVLTAELAKIETIHSECTLGSAEGSITASLSPSPSVEAASRTVATSITVSTSATTGAMHSDRLKLSGKSGKGFNIPEVDISISVNETASQIRDAILAGIASGISSVDPQITAEVSANAVVVHAPAADEISWTAAQVNAAASGVKVEIQSLVPKTAAGRPGEAAR